MARLRGPGAAAPTTPAPPTSDGFTEVKIAEPVAQQRLLASPPTPKFYLRHHPERWGLMGGKFRPILGRLAVDPGVGGVDRHGNIEVADVQGAKNGWTRLPWSAIKHSPDPEYASKDGYIKGLQARAGVVHMSVFEAPSQVGRRVTMRTDTEGYYRWLDALVEKGLIPEIHPDVMEALVDSARHSAEAAAQSPNRARAKQAEAHYRAVQRAASEAAGEDPEPAPKPRRKPGPKPGPKPKEKAE